MASCNEAVSCTEAQHETTAARWIYVIYRAVACVGIWTAWTASAGRGRAITGCQKRHRTKTGRGQEGRGQEEARKRPGRGQEAQEETGERPGRGQEEAATVLSYEPRTGAIVVETETRQVLCVYPVTDDDVPVGRVTYYPVRAGYADTVHKFQGAELPHVTFWPDREGCPAAGYVALSRVRKDEDYLLGGYIKPEHVVPAR